MIDRTVQPKIKGFTAFEMPEIIEHSFGNSLPFLYLPIAKNELVRIDFVFEAGVANQSMPLQALFTNSLLTEGTQTYSADKVADCLDYFGAYVDKRSGKDFSKLSFYVAIHNLKNIIDLIEEIILSPQFPEEEIELFRKKLLQDYQVYKERIDFLSKQKFVSHIHQNTPYQTDLISETYINAIQRDDILEFYRENYTLNKAKIFVTASSSYYSEIELMLSKRFAVQNDDLSKKSIEVNKIDSPSTGNKFQIHKEGSQQAAITIGKECVGRSHPDYAVFSFLNTALGGFFGSRLMSNLREEKGYTYGISSSIMTSNHQSVFQIETEVNLKVRDQALEEIYKEVELLKKEKLIEEEMRTIKNYIFGSLIRSLDSVYSISEKIIYLRNYNLGIDYYKGFLNKIEKIRAEDLLRVANLQFDTTAFTEVLVADLKRN